MKNLLILYNTVDTCYNIMISLDNIVCDFQAVLISTSYVPYGKRADSAGEMVATCYEIVESHVMCVKFG